MLQNLTALNSRSNCVYLSEFFRHESVDIQTNARDDSKQQHKAKETLASKDENVDLLDLVRDKARSDLYVVNVDAELTETIRKTFQRHGCQVMMIMMMMMMMMMLMMMTRLPGLRVHAGAGPHHALCLAE